MLPRYPINATRQHLWQQDVAASVAQYNTWFMKFAPAAFRDKREHVAEKITGMNTAEHVAALIQKRKQIS